MRTALRALLAAITGSLVTIVLTYFGVIVLLVVRIGMPLGSAARDPTNGEYVGLLMIAGGAAAIGGHIAAGIARHTSRGVIVVIAAFLAGGALWGFTGSRSNWPAWWAPALAGVAAFGTWVGGGMLRRASGGSGRH